MDAQQPEAPAISVDLGGADPDAALPVLNEEAPPLNLPPRAKLLADGTVHLDLEFPTTLQYRPVGGGAVVRTERHEHLTFRRLGGKDVRRLLDAKNATDLAVAISAGLTHAKFAILQEKMDSADIGAAQSIINELLGDMTRDGLPPHAKETDEGIHLPLFYSADDGEGEHHTELLFKRMSGGDRKAIAGAADTLTWSLHRATGLTPKAAKVLIDNMDGADVVAANKVIGFLSGSGRTAR